MLPEPFRAAIARDFAADFVTEDAAKRRDFLRKIGYKR